ncbi:MAG: hypothetical protein ABIO17_03050 [Pseudoxanthomonas sp.]
MIPTALWQSVRTPWKFIQTISTPILGASRIPRAAALQRERERRGAAQRSLILKSGLDLLLGSLLAVGGSGYFAWKSQQIARQAEFPAAVVEAMQAGALTRCGDSICARIGYKPKRFGDKGQYAVVK